MAPFLGGSPLAEDQATSASDDCFDRSLQQPVDIIRLEFQNPAACVAARLVFFDRARRALGDIYSH